MNMRGGPQRVGLGRWSLRRTWDVAAWSGKAAEALSVLNHRYERDSEYVAGFSFTLLVPRDQHEFLVAIG